MESVQLSNFLPVKKNRFEKIRPSPSIVWKTDGATSMRNKTQVMSTQTDRGCFTDRRLVQTGEDLIVRKDFSCTVRPRNLKAKLTQTSRIRFIPSWIQAELNTLVIDKMFQRWKRLVEQKSENKAWGSLVKTVCGEMKRSMRGLRNEVEQRLSDQLSLELSLVGNAVYGQLESMVLCEKSRNIPSTRNAATSPVKEQINPRDPETKLMFYPEGVSPAAEKQWLKKPHAYQITTVYDTAGKHGRDTMNTLSSPSADSNSGESPFESSSSSSSSTSSEVSSIFSDDNSFPKDVMLYNENTGLQNDTESNSIGSKPSPIPFDPVSFLPSPLSESKVKKPDNYLEERAKSMAVAAVEDAGRRKYFNLPPAVRREANFLPDLFRKGHHEDVGYCFGDKDMQVDTNPFRSHTLESWVRKDGHLESALRRSTWQQVQLSVMAEHAVKGCVNNTANKSLNN